MLVCVCGEVLVPNWGDWQLRSTYLTWDWELPFHSSPSSSHKRTWLRLFVHSLAECVSVYISTPLPLEAVSAFPVAGAPTCLAGAPASPGDVQDFFRHERKSAILSDIFLHQE